MNVNVAVFELILSFSTLVSYGQRATPASSMLRLFEDNDFINIKFSGTDKAYTHGFRVDLFYTKQNGSSAIADRLTLKAGNESVDTFGWGIMQTIMTPGDLSSTVVDVSDYRYACSLNIFRMRHSSNPVKKYNIQTEYAMGVLGPVALGKETQDAMHRLIKDEIARGWNTQLKTAVLLNLNLAAEKQLIGIKGSVECIGGMRSSVGTSLTSFSIYTLLRIGRMNPYFSGYLSQYLQHGKGHESWQLFVILRPALDLVLRNAHVQGGTFKPERTEVYKGDGGFVMESEKKLNHIGCALDYGIVITLKNVSISFTQRDLYAMIKEQTRHETGNITVYFAL